MNLFEKQNTKMMIVVVSLKHFMLPQHPNRLDVFQSTNHVCIASLAQLVARRSHNPKVVSSILTGSTFFWPTK